MRDMPSPSGPEPDPIAPDPSPGVRRPAASGRRWLAIGLASGVLVAGAFTAVRGGSIGSVGAVAGAVATGTPTPEPVLVAAAATPVPTPDATPRAVQAPRELPDPTPAPVMSLREYVWPLPRGRLTLPFGPTSWGSRIVDGEKFHDGIDLATFCGDRIVAAHDGRVLTAGRHFDAYMGWVGDLQPYLDRLEKKKLYPTLPIVVVIDDGNGYRSIYAHFNKVVVKAGQEVKAGDFLGYEGATGRASGCHLHYGLFSPYETATFLIDPDVVDRMKLPDREIARIDPLLVLPERPKPTPKPTPVPTMPP